jgi:arsenate reductase (glutaredoxin)
MWYLTQYAGNDQAKRRGAGSHRVSQNTTDTGKARRTNSSDGHPPRQLLRQKGTPYDALGLSDPKWTDDELIDFMLANPILINRPIVVTDKGVRLCRPSEAVLDILSNPNIGDFRKEDGEVVPTRRSID